MRFNHVLRLSASSAVLAAVMATAGAAFAQDATSVDEIVVTAQKREQNLQDVPVVVTSLPASLLQNAGVKDIKDMQVLTPGLTVTSTSNESSTTARIRGVGTVGDNPGLESSVGVVIDGVYRPRNGVGFGDLGELQRIEVLKGPQGTLFGKNTSAGVINIVTKAPSFQAGSEGEITVGNYGAFGVSGAITGPLVADKVAGRLFVSRRVRDGFYDVKTGDGPRDNKEDNDQDYWTARGQLLFTPTDKVSVRLIADYTKRSENCCAAAQIRTGPTAGFVNALSAGGQGVMPAAPGYAVLPFSRTAYSNRDTDQDVTDKGVSAEAKVDLDSIKGSFTSVTGVRNWKIVNGQDIDYTGADILYRKPGGGNGAEFTSLSQEFRLAGQHGALNWLVGAFMASEDLTTDTSYYFGSDYNAYLSFLLTATVPNVPFGGPSPSRLGCFTNPAGYGGTACVVGLAPPSGSAPLFGAGHGVQDRYDQTDKTFALFTNNSYSITDKLEATIGLRYTRDSKTLETHYDNVGSNGSACLGALANQSNANAALRTPAAALGVICLPWANPFFDARTTNQKRSESEWSGTAKLAYRWNDALMTYASYARGYKAGGFNHDRIQSATGLPNGAAGVTPVRDTSFEGEFVDSYEIGAKSTLLGNKLLVNLTYFDQTYENFQLNTFLGTSFVVESIPEVTSRGVDADFIWFTPLAGFTLQGGVTYANTRYSNFKAADLVAPSHFPDLSLLPGSRISFAPEWSASFNATYDHEIGENLRFLASLSGKYTSEYNTGSDLLPFKVQDSLTLLNGRIGIGAADKSWTLEFWGQNLTDEDYKQVVFNGPLQGTSTTATPAASGPFKGAYYALASDTRTYDAFLGAPRTFGATLRLRY